MQGPEFLDSGSDPDWTSERTVKDVMDHLGDEDTFICMELGLCELGTTEARSI